MTQDEGTPPTGRETRDSEAVGGGPDATSSKVAVIVGIAAAAGFLLVLALAAGQSSWWGLHGFRYLGTGGRVLVVGLAVVAAILAGPGAGWFSAGVSGSWRRWPAGVRDAVLAIGFGAVAWVLRDRTHLLGDGSVLLDHAQWPLAFHDREPLGAAILAGVSRVAELTKVSYPAAYEAFSVLLGTALVVLLARTDRAVGARGLLLLLGFVHGAMQLWFGYIEFYPPAAFVVVLALLAARPAVTRRASLVPVLAWSALAVLIHISSVVLAPMVAWCVVRQLRLRNDARGRALVLGEGVGVALLAFGLWAVVWARVEAPSLPGYLSLLLESGRFGYGAAAADLGGPGVGSGAHWIAFGNQVALLSGVAWLLVIGAGVFLLRGAAAQRSDAGDAASSADGASSADAGNSAADTGNSTADPAADAASRTRCWSRDPWIVPLAIAAGSYLAAQFQFFPSLGPPRDWDALAVGAFPVGLLAARLVAASGWMRARPVIAAVLVMHVAPWILVNANPTAAHERFAEMPMAGGQAEYVLAVRALKADEWDEASRRFESITKDVPMSVHGWHGLGLARDGAGDVAAALDAFEHALAVQTADPRVSRVELLERIGNCQWRLGNADRATRAFQAALDAAPPEDAPATQARIFLAVMAAQAGEQATVWELLEPALPHRSTSPAILVLSAQALRALGRGEEAAPLIREAKALFPGDAGVQALPEGP